MLQSQPHFIFSQDYTLTGSAGAPRAQDSFRGPSAGPCLQNILLPPEEHLSAFAGAGPQFPRFYRKQPKGGKSGSSSILSTTSAICCSNGGAGDLVAPLCAFPSRTWSLRYGVSFIPLSSLRLEFKPDLPPTVRTMRKVPTSNVLSLMEFQEPHSWCSGRQVRTRSVTIPQQPPLCPLPLTVPPRGGH